MEIVTATYDATEQAWVSPVLELKRDIYLMIILKRPGKLVIRQRVSDGSNPRVPIRRHKDTTSFKLRLTIIPESVGLQIFTSTEPKEIKYAYI
jgi:hypothetical protein